MSRQTGGEQSAHQNDTGRHNDNARPASSVPNDSALASCARDAYTPESSSIISQMRAGAPGSLPNSAGTRDGITGNPNSIDIPSLFSADGRCMSGGLAGELIGKPQAPGATGRQVTAEAAVPGVASDAPAWATGKPSVAGHERAAEPTRPEPAVAEGKRPGSPESTPAPAAAPEPSSLEAGSPPDAKPEKFNLESLFKGSKSIPEMRSDELKTYGQEPTEVVKQLMAQNRVLGIGEHHDPSFDEQRKLGPEIIAKAKEGGATHLAVELPTWFQPVLERFEKTGDFKEFDERTPTMEGKEDFKAILSAARENGLKIQAVDDRERYGEPEVPLAEREQAMASNINSILESDPNNKVVFWVGANHLARPQYPGSPKTAAEQLRTDHGRSVATIHPISPGESKEKPGEKEFGLLGETATEISKPTAVSTKDAPTIGGTELEKSRASLRGDYLIFYPPKR